MNEVKYPDVAVCLVGEDGNAFSIIARVTKALRNHGVDKGEVDTFVNEAMDCGSYDELLQLVMNWVDV